MATRDAQDILDVKRTDRPGPGRPKKKALKQKLVRPSHISKEVWLLETQGDRTPPVSLTLQKPRKPAFKRRVRPWEWQAFTNPQRSDGLVLHHWRKKNFNTEGSALATEQGPATPADGEATPAGESGDQEAPVKQEPMPDHSWTKYNTKVDIPRYTDKEYAARLQSDEWSKEETDYLMQLAEDFDLRWVLIADRYDYQSSAMQNADGDAMALVPASPIRTMEDMKARYYKIAAVMMDVRMGLSNMTPAEFSLYEKMTKFDPTKETRRKKMAEQLLQRTDEEIEEERRLLIELKRIIQEEDDFIRERTELFERLNAPSSRQSISQFENSQGLMALMQNLLVQDKARRGTAAMAQRRAISGVEDTSNRASTAPATPTTATGRGTESRKSLDNAAGASERRKEGKGSHASASIINRKLTAAEEKKYGVSRPDKLLTGEKIRHVRIEKRVTARASSVAAKVQDSMVELGVPIKPCMATGPIVSRYEELCTSLDTLLDFRRQAEKTENEIKVLKAKNDVKDGQEDGGTGENSGKPTRDNDPGTINTAGTQEKGGDAKPKANIETVDGQATEGTNDKDKDKDRAEETTKTDDGEDDGDDVQNKSGGEEDYAGDENDDEEGDDDDGKNDVKESDDAETPAADALSDDDEDSQGDADNTSKSANRNEQDDAEDDVEDDEQDTRPGTEAEGESRPSTRASGRKRSVSVLSSAPSQKSSKRIRK